MPSFSRRTLGLVALLVVTTCAAHAAAQQQARGFALDRFDSSAPGAGWFVMDALDMRGGLGGVMALTTSYARDPLRITEGAQRLGVVTSQAFADFGLAFTYHRWRLYLNLDAPLDAKGRSGLIGDTQFAGPHLNLGSNPDSLSDPRLGVDVRIIGGPAGRFRLGAGAQLIVPNGPRADYFTDGTFRGMARALAAGDLGRFSYAGQLGMHVRPLDDASTPGSPRGSEMLFGAAGGARLATSASGATAFVVGAEIYGATALQSLFGSSATALEGMLSGRIEGTADSERQLRVKLGVGAGLHPDFGAPEWRLVVAIEIFNRDFGKFSEAP